VPTSQVDPSLIMINREGIQTILPSIDFADTSETFGNRLRGGKAPLRSDPGCRPGDAIRSILDTDAASERGSGCIEAGYGS
jgi:hypothetical protein